MSAKNTVGLFDFDGTLARGDSALPFILFTLRRYPRALIEFTYLAALAPGYGLGLVTKKRIKNAMLKILMHVPPPEREALARNFHDRVIRPRYFAKGLERVGWHKQQGHTLILATASVDFYMNHIAGQLGFDVLVATRTAIEPVPTVTGANCYGQEKVKRLKELDLYEQTDWANSWAYSDHLSDRPILELCGRRMATTPSRALRRHARREGWQVVDWS